MEQPAVLSGEMDGNDRCPGFLDQADRDFSLSMSARYNRRDNHIKMAVDLHRHW
jgi:hypothetical protein